MHYSRWYLIILVFIKIGEFFNFITGGKKSVDNNGHNQKLHNDGDGGGDSDNGVVGLIPKTLSDSDTRDGHINSRSKEAILRDVTARAKRAHRGKRRR